LLNEFIKPAVNQIVITIEITVKKIAAKPIFFDLSSDCRKYLMAGQIPNGGRKTLRRYINNCLVKEVDSSFSFKFFPQTGQKKSDEETLHLQFGQVT